MKNANLCQRARCREPYTKIVTGWDPRFGGRGWTLHVCDFHAAIYEDAQKNHMHLLRVRVDRRKPEAKA